MEDEKEEIDFVGTRPTRGFVLHIGEGQSVDPYTDQVRVNHAARSVEEVEIRCNGCEATIRESRETFPNLPTVQHLREDLASRNRWVFSGGEGFTCEACVESLTDPNNDDSRGLLIAAKCGSCQAEISETVYGEVGPVEESTRRSLMVKAAGWDTHQDHKWRCRACQFLQTGKSLPLGDGDATFLVSGGSEPVATEEPQVETLGGVALPCESESWTSAAKKLDEGLEANRRARREGLVAHHNDALSLLRRYARANAKAFSLRVASEVRINLPNLLLMVATSEGSGSVPQDALDACSGFNMDNLAGQIERAIFEAVIEPATNWDDEKEAQR